MSQTAEVIVDVREREIILRLLSAAAFVIFFKSFLVAPLIPSLVKEFHASEQWIGLLIPAYMLPYGFSTLIYGPLSDRVGRRPILLALLGAMIVTAIGTATAQTVTQFILWRVFAGMATGGTIPISLALLGDLFPYNQRGRAMGWVFGAIAGGMAFGSTLGALLNPIIGWRVVFVAIGVSSAVLFLIALRHRRILEGPRANHPPGLAVAFKGYFSLLRNRRGLRTYIFITLNGIFHSGLFSWLGLFFARKYHLGDQGIGLALLGYGVPGLLLGPVIGHAADRLGRKTLIPVGLALGGLCAIALIPSAPLAWAVVVVTILSFGFDMSHPLLAGIITSVDPARRGQAMGLNAFVLFTGMGLGSLLFQQLIRWGFPLALGAFSVVQLSLAIVAVPIFKREGTMAQESGTDLPPT
jgi:predicted MFS family arabinose efflux permease